MKCPSLTATYFKEGGYNSMDNKKLKATPALDQESACIERYDGKPITCEDAGVSCSTPIVPVPEKYLLTIKEAASYFNIGTKKLCRLAEENSDRFSVYSGNRYLIIRPKFEKFVDDSSEI